MLSKGFIKPTIRIKKLGKRQFWIGIIVGIVVSFILSYFFNYSRESLRAITFTGDPFILTEKEFGLYDLFFAFFATSLGFGLTIIFWLRGRNQNIKRRFLKTYAISNSILIVIVALMSVARFGSILPIIVYGLYGYDGHLDLLHDFWLLLILIPLYVFFANWNTIRLLFRARYWMLLSFVFFVITSFFIYKTTHVNRDILNQTYYSKNKERFDYIDSEFKKASKLGVFYDETTRQILRKRNAERTTDLVFDIKQAFNNEGKVSLDTLILQKIVIHNLHWHGFLYGRGHDIDENWPYALPEKIYCQIMKHDVDDVETKILFEILAEQISIFNASYIPWNNYQNHTQYEIEKSRFRLNLMFNTITIQSRLVQIVEELKSEKRFDKYHHLLSDLEFDDDKGRQKHIELELTGINSLCN